VPHLPNRLLWLPGWMILRRLQQQQHPLELAPNQAHPGQTTSTDQQYPSSSNITNSIPTPQSIRAQPGIIGQAAAVLAADPDELPSTDDEADEASPLPLPRVKVRFMVQQSRLAFGVPDPTRLLDYGQAFFQPTVDGTPTVVRACAVVVSSSWRNSPLHSSDVSETGMACRAAASGHPTLLHPVETWELQMSSKLLVNSHQVRVHAVLVLLRLCTGPIMSGN